jgi:beta-lactamase regulating signal transducer with metallopeptidase domain
MDLTSFQHSFFLGALGNAILNSLWQGFLLWVVYETILISYKSMNAKIRHNLSVLMIFCSFVWFITTVFQNFLLNETDPTFLPDTTALIIPDNSKSSFPDFFRSITGDVLPYLSIAYITLLFFLMAKLFTSYRRVNYISTKNLIAPPAHLESFSSKAAWQLRISKKIHIWISHHIEVPATIGFIKPVILIPFASINNLTTHQLEAIILHELCHIKRNDYLVNLLVSVIEALLFFNPFVAIFIKTIKRERENCCDDFVLQYSYDPHSYASALLSLEQSRKENVQLALGAVSGKKQLLSRIMRITGNNTAVQFNYGHKLLALLVTTGIFCSLAWLSPGKIRKETKESLTVSLSASGKTLADANGHNGTMNQDQTLSAQSKAKLNERKLNSPEIPALELNIDEEAQQVDKDQNELNPDKNTNLQFSLNTDNQTLNPSETNIAELVKKGVVKLNIRGLADVDQQISKGLNEAYLEISKIDWNKVQTDINKSIPEIKINDLPQDQKAAITKAKKYLSLIRLNDQKANASKIVDQIQKQQKLIADSLNAAGTILINQRPAKMAATFSNDEVMNFKIPGVGFSINIKTGSGKKAFTTNNIRSQSQNGAFNATELKSMITDGVPGKISGQGSQQRVKKIHRVIVDI